jgi:hypothetical protein
MPKPFGNTLGLTPVTGPERAAVHLDQTYNIRLYLFKETDYFIKDGMGMFKIPGIGNRGMKAGADTGAIPDIVEKKTHALAVRG